MSTAIRNELCGEIGKHLYPYLEKCVSFYFSGDADLVELNARVNEDDVSETVVVRVNIKDNCTQLHIPNIFFPRLWRGKGDGMKLIKVIYQVARNYNYDLFMTFMTDGFYQLMISRGAPAIDADNR